jgi:hypothetical protein
MIRHPLECVDDLRFYIFGSRPPNVFVFVRYADIEVFVVSGFSL